MRVGRIRRTYVFAIAATLLAVAASGCGRSDWGPVQPQYTKDSAPYGTNWTEQGASRLNAVRGFDGGSVYAVGQNGTILHSIDGEHWDRQSLAGNLNAIFGTPDGKKLWTVGDTATILHSTDGEHWIRQSSKLPFSISLYSIFGTQDGNQLWAVGDFGTILRSTDGEHWTIQRTRPNLTKVNSPLPDQYNTLRAIFGTPSGKELWIVGDAGTILHSTDGQHWATVSSGTRMNLLSVFGSADGKQLWAAGDAGTIIHSTDSQQWSVQSLNVRLNIRSLSGSPDGKQLWAVGELEEPDGKFRQAILHSSDGKHWTVQYSRESGCTRDSVYISGGCGLNSVFSMPDTKQVWAVGTKFYSSRDNPSMLRDKSTILHSIDGEHWALTRIDPDAILFSLFGTPDGKQLWAVGERVIEDGKRSGTILHSEDGGAWEVQYSETNVFLWSVFGTPDGKSLWAVGQSGALGNPEHGLILHTIDGKHWVTQSIGTGMLNSIFGSSDGKQLWAIGGSRTLRSTDGEHWAALDLPAVRHPPKFFGMSPPPDSPPGLLSISGTSDAKQLWAVGDDDTILHSTDGQHWSLQDFDDRKSDDFLFAIFGTSDGKRLWAVGGNMPGMTQPGEPPHCTILNSNDGKHWTRQSCGTGKPLFSIWGTSDGKRLWAVGEGGIILHSTDGEHWTICNPRPMEKFYDGTFQSVFGTRDGNRLWVTETGPGQSEEPTVGVLLEGQTSSFHAPYIKSARLDATPRGARLQLKLSQLVSPLQLKVDVRNDFDSEHNRPAPQFSKPIWPRVERINYKPPPDSFWSFDFDPREAAIGRGERAHFDIILETSLEQHFYYTATYDPYYFLRENYRWIAPVGVALLVPLCFTLFLFVKPLWNLPIYRFLKLNRIEKIDLPVIGDFLQVFLRVVTVLPWFVTQPRTLDAWLRKYSKSLASIWQESTRRDIELPAVASSSPLSNNYVPLPIRVGAVFPGNLIERPAAADFRRYAVKPRFTLQIIGPGGAGKTTLARQLGDWATENSSDSGIASHPMLPVWVDEELDADKKPLSAVILGKLRAALPEEELEEEFCLALLRKQRLLVIVDRLSERSSSTQHHIETIYRSTKINCLVLTSRSLMPVEGSKNTVIYPQALDQNTILPFMTALLSSSSCGAENEDDAAKTPLSNFGEQVSLLGKFATLLGKDDIPLVPLHVRLFVEEAILLTHEGKGLDNLSASLPEVYFRYLRRVNPEDSSLQNFLDGDRMLKIAKRLGKVAVGKDFIPKEFSRDAAVLALQDVGEKLNDSCDPIARLVQNGVLIRKSGGLATLLRFSLDPVAEFLAAAQYAEEARDDASQWDVLLRNCENAPGFRTALMLTRQAYAKQMGWSVAEPA